MALEAQDKSQECLELAAKSKIETLMQSHNAKPRAKRLVWKELPHGEEWEAECGVYTLCIVKDNEDYIIWNGDTELNIPSCDTLAAAKQAAQKWLDKLVEECAEIANSEDK